MAETDAEVKNGVRKHVMFSPETWEKLETYLVRKYGLERGLSLTVEQAVRELLDKEGAL